MMRVAVRVNSTEWKVLDSIEYSKVLDCYSWVSYEFNVLMIIIFVFSKSIVILVCEL